MTDLTPEELTKGEKLLGTATPKPWHHNGDAITAAPSLPHVAYSCYGDDAALIVWARNNAPALIAEIRRMRDDSWVRKYNAMRREVRQLNVAIRRLVAELPQVPCDLCGAAKDEVCAPGCESYS